MKLFDESTSITDDLKNVFRHHNIKLDDETAIFYVELLQKGSKQGKSPLKLMDEMIEWELEKRFLNNRGRPRKEYKNKNGARDYDRENLTRTMRFHNLSEFEALKYIEKRKKQQQEKFLKKNKHKDAKPQIDLQPGFTVYSNLGTFNFKNKTEAAKYIADNFYNGHQGTARTSLNRNLLFDKVSIKGWCAYFFE